MNDTRFAAHPSRDGIGYSVRVTWPDGHQQEIDGFDSESHALEWIDTHSAMWLTWHPRTVMSRQRRRQ